MSVVVVTKLLVLMVKGIHPHKPPKPTLNLPIPQRGTQLLPPVLNSYTDTSSCDVSVSVRVPRGNGVTVCDTGRRYSYDSPSRQMLQGPKEK